MRLRTLLIAALLLAPALAFAAEVPVLRFGVESTDSPQDVGLTLQIVFLLTVLALAPSILIMMTSFTRIVIVLSFLRNALGTPTAPPNQVLMGLALFLTFFIMAPTWNQVYTSAIGPYMDGQLTQEQALEAADPPVRKFLLTHARDKDIALFVTLSGSPMPKGPEEVSYSALVPAFIISELRTAFIMGFLLYLPFVIIDMVVASTLMSMGMFMLPPMMISLPFKLVLFVVVDGWNMVVGSLARSFF